MFYRKCRKVAAWGGAAGAHPLDRTRAPRRAAGQGNGRQELIGRIAVLAVVALTIATGSVARAAQESDVVGIWAVDVAGLKSEMERMLEEQFRQLPEAQQKQARAMAAVQLDAMVGQMAGEAEFRPDGTAIFTSAEDPPTTGTWTLDNGTLRFGRDQRAQGEPAYIGEVDGDVIRVEPEGRNPNNHFTLTLRRQ